jgi:hypothetical protein
VVREAASAGNLASGKRLPRAVEPEWTTDRRRADGGGPSENSSVASEELLVLTERKRDMRGDSERSERETPDIKRAVHGRWQSRRRLAA